MSAQGQDQATVTITIDGKPFTVVGRHHTADALLRVANIDPSQYELGKVNPNGDAVTYRDDQPVELHDGEKFVMVRKSASVA